MRVVWEYMGRLRAFDVDKDSLIVGRTQPGAPVDVDLFDDLGVSRRHARIFLESGRLWIEDLNSKFGTVVNGRAIKGAGKHALALGDTIEIGASVLRVETVEPRAAAADGHIEAGKTGHIAASLRVAAAVEAGDTTAATRKLAMLYALPLQFGAATDLDRLLETIVRQLIEVIPGAARSALLVRDRASGQLLLKAHMPIGTPRVSLTLAHRVMVSREALVWNRTPDPSLSQREHAMLSAMYAPLIWQDEPLGVVCVDNAEKESAFDVADLQLILTVARYAAMAVVHRKLQDDLARNATLLSRLLTNFSPRVRDRLLAKAERGRLRLGGEKSEITILCSDIRGFTRISASMDAEDVVDMLNDYFSALVDALFACDGTIDKFVGDAILAVFGSPEPDPQQHEKAVRAAVRMQAAVKTLNEQRRARNLVTCDIGIGVHCGEVMHGFIGTAERMEFTVIGDAVNLAARYCDGAKGTEVLISQAMHERVWRMVDAEPAAVPTKHEGDLPGYRVKALKVTG